MRLCEVDRVYLAVRDEMTVQEKITYCSRLIYRTHLQLARSGAHLTRHGRQKSLQILQYARFELDELLRNSA